MLTDVTTFTPFASLAGGALIGLAAGWLLLARGRIAGISGLLGQLFPAYWDRRFVYTREPRTAMAFLSGLVLASLLPGLAGWNVTPHVQATPLMLIGAGLLVGFGTRLGGGCTSGHGVCGLARLSRRSMVATMLFMGSAMLTVWLQKVLA